MKQNFSINQQGPSHGPEWKRPKPHTLIYHNKTRSDSNGLVEQPSAQSLTFSQKAGGGAYKKRMTEITLLASEQEKSWKKIQLYQPVLSTTRMMCSFNFNPMQSVTMPTAFEYFSNQMLDDRSPAIQTEESLNQAFAFVRTSAVPTRQKNSRQQSFVKNENKLDATQDTIPTQLTTISYSRATLSNNHSALLFGNESSKPGSSLCTPKPS